VERSGLSVSVGVAAVPILLLSNCMFAVNYFLKKEIRLKMVAVLK